MGRLRRPRRGQKKNRRAIDNPLDHKADQYCPTTDRSSEVSSGSSKDLKGCISYSKQDDDMLQESKDLEARSIFEFLIYGVGLAKLTR